MSKKNRKNNSEVEVQEEVSEKILAAADAIGAFNEQNPTEPSQEDYDKSQQSQEESEDLELSEEVQEVLEASGDEDSELNEMTATEGSELDSFESAEIEEQEFVSDEEVESIIESMLFATDKPQGLATFKNAFKGTNVKTKHIKEALENLTIEYAGARRGVTLEEVNGGYQLRTKVDNMEFLKRMVKARAFKLSGPALEVLSIVAYKQPCVKHAVDEIRGVESGHLLRGLMDRGLVCFSGKSELPGKPMLYSTTKKFLEIFGLRNLQELPSLNEIDELIPEGIGEEEEKETLDIITENMSEEVGQSYSEGEEELMKISDQLSDIDTSSEFFEEEKRRMKAKRDAEKARDIREAIEMGDDVSTRDRNWLERYDLALKEQEEADIEKVTEVSEAELEAENESDPSSREQTDQELTDKILTSHNDSNESRNELTMPKEGEFEASIEKISLEANIEANNVTNHNEEIDSEKIISREEEIPEAPPEPEV